MKFEVESEEDYPVAFWRLVLLLGVSLETYESPMLKGEKEC